MFAVNGCDAAVKMSTFMKSQPFECGCFSDPEGQRRKWGKALTLITV